MRSRTIVGSLTCLAILALAYTVSARAAAPAVKWALINMTETTWIAGRFVSGPVMFEPRRTVHARAQVPAGQGPG